MEVVNHDDDEIKSAADLALDESNDVEANEEAKESLAQTPLEEALANSREAVSVATIAIQSSSQMTTHILALEEVLLSKGVINVKEFRAQLDHVASKASELSNAEIKNVINKAGGLSPDDGVNNA